MSIRSKLILVFSVIVVLAAAVAVYGVMVVTQSGALVVRLYDGPFMAATHARVAQVRFGEARAALERAVNARDSTSALDTKAIDDTIEELMAELKVVGERITTGDAPQAVANAISLTQDWVSAGMTILKPPPDGVVEIPPLLAVQAKADQVAVAIDDVAEAAAAYGFEFRTDAETVVTGSRTTLIALAIVTVLLGTVLALGTAYSLTKPLAVLVGLLQRLAQGEEVAITGIERRDEIGATARAVNGIKEMLAAKARRDAAEKAEQDRQASGQRKAATARIADEFQAAVGRIVQSATAGDFSRRVALEGTSGLVLNVGTMINALCDNVAKALGDLVQMLSALAEGDLTQRITADHRGDFATLKDNANSTAERIGKTIAGIKLAACEVTNASAEISTSTTDLSQRTEDQAARLEETSASMVQISATVQKNAENAQHANQSAATTRAVADRGGQVVAKAVKAMARIEDSSCKISDIIGVIDEIARQTNLLALNAAVEAARAGDAGRGFAVVASEVRSLAQRSSEAAKNIKELITNSNGEVKEGVRLVNEVGSALGEIVESIKSFAAIVADIAAASAAQSIDIEQVNKALSQMDEVTQQNSALVEENAASAKTLEDQSTAMDELIGFFRIDEAASGQATPAPKRSAVAVIAAAVA
ncbi:MAG TPA: methyl-accepting chemotaxis protein [Xanthobacteraceae bacterium]